MIVMATIKLTRIVVEGSKHMALEVNGHYLELRTLVRHPLKSVALLWSWLRASHEGGIG